MKETHNSEAVPCTDRDPAELFEQGLAPEEYHDLREVTQERIADRSIYKILFIEEQCSCCSARISGIQVLGDAPKSMQNIKWMIYDVYEAFYQDPRSVQYVSMGQYMFELGQETVLELCTSLQLAAVLARKEAEDGTDKRTKQELWTRILGPEYADDD